MRVSPPTVGGHDRRGVGQQLLGVILVTVGGEVKYGMAGSEHPPQRALGALQPPAGLVHVQAVAGAHQREQVFVGSFQGIARAREGIASIVPEQMRAPNSSSESSAASRRLT